VKTALLALFGAVSIANAAEVVLPDACDNHVCLTDLRWKKGAVTHTLTGFISSPEPIISLNIVFSYTDGRQRGTTRLGMINVKGSKTPFYFKVHEGLGLLNPGSLQWDRSSVRVEASAILGLAALQKDGVSCTFDPHGSRLGVTIKNESNEDLVLDYSLLTLISNGESLRLNGTHGKFADLDKPNPNTLISSEASVSEQFIPMGSVTFANGGWVEDWRLHDALVAAKPTLALPLSVAGQTRIEKLPLEVRSARMASAGQATK
jgi:hypothetical protein